MNISLSRYHMTRQKESGNNVVPAVNEGRDFFIWSTQ